MRALRATHGPERPPFRLRDLSFVAALAVLAALSSPALTSPSQELTASSASLLAGDEPVVRSTHALRTRSGAMTYQAIVGRMPIRVGETGEVRARLFFVAYVVETNGPRRPLTFAWNGGPNVPAVILNLDGLGPRRRTKNNDMVDNPDTLLATTDLVFMDPVRTGYSRPERPEFLPEFMNTEGDVATTLEFIRAYRARFHASDQPLFIAGESYGVFRASAVADKLTAAGQGLAGTVLISGDIPNFPQTAAFYNAMHVPARTATAIYHHRLKPDRPGGEDEKIAEAAKWADEVYRPALMRVDSLSDSERAAIAERLALYTGVAPSDVNPRTLVVTVKQYLANFFGAYAEKKLTYEDTRVLDGSPDDNLGSGKAVDAYIRGELGYLTDMNYAGLEAGYSSTPGPKTPSIREMWIYNQPGVTPTIVSEMWATGEVWPLASANPPWVGNALVQDKRTRFFIATGRFDPLNMCEGNAKIVESLASELASRIATKCYAAGHIIYREDAVRPVFLRDVSDFIRDQSAHYAAEEKH
jgi:carboxypeptidase C (cathepsin A)